MRVARIDVAPRVDHCYDRLAGIVCARIAHLRNARMMAEATHVGFAEPTVRTQLLRFLASHRSVTIVVLAIDYIRGWSDRRIECAGKVSVFRWQPDRTNTPFGSIGSRYSRVAKAWRPSSAFAAFLSADRREMSAASAGGPSWMPRTWLRDARSRFFAPCLAQSSLPSFRLR